MTSASAREIVKLPSLRYLNLWSTQVCSFQSHSLILRLSQFSGMYCFDPYFLFVGRITPEKLWVDFHGIWETGRYGLVAHTAIAQLSSTGTSLE